MQISNCTGSQSTLPPCLHLLDLWKHIWHVKNTNIFKSFCMHANKLHICDIYIHYTCELSRMKTALQRVTLKKATWKIDSIEYNKDFRTIALKYGFRQLCVILWFASMCILFLSLTFFIAFFFSLRRIVTLMRIIKWTQLSKFFFQCYASEILITLYRIFFYVAFSRAKRYKNVFILNISFTFYQQNKTFAWKFEVNGKIYEVGI